MNANLNTTLPATLILVLLMGLMIVSINGVVAAQDPIVVAIDLAHGQSSKYVVFMQGNITWVRWKNITERPITSEVLADVDIFIIGGYIDIPYSVEELTALNEWLNQGNKVLWVSGDSDYGTGPSRINNANAVLEFIESKLRIEHGSVYDDINNAGRANYRTLARVMPDNIPWLRTHIISAGITKPVLYHGTSCVIWTDGVNYYDTVNKTFDGLIRIVWTYDAAYYSENNPPAGWVYIPGVDTNRTFVLLAGEYIPNKNNLILASGESPYGDYEPTWSSFYYGVELDGPKFVTNMINWFISIITEPPTPPEIPTITITETIYTTTTALFTTTRYETITTRVTVTATVVSERTIPEIITETKTTRITEIRLETTTIPVPTLDVATTAIAGIVTLVIGLFIGSMILKRR